MRQLSCPQHVMATQIFAWLLAWTGRRRLFLVQRVVAVQCRLHALSQAFPNMINADKGSVGLPRPACARDEDMILQLSDLAGKCGPPQQGLRGAAPGCAEHRAWG